MAEIWKPHDPFVYLQWLAAIKNEASETLNDWEIQFCHSLIQRLKTGANLTQLQAEKLESIYAEHTK